MSSSSGHYDRPAPIGFTLLGTSEGLQRCFMVDCHEIGSIEDQTRLGVYWCTSHANRIAYCCICGRVPLCTVAQHPTDCEPSGAVQVPRHGKCRAKALDAAKTNASNELLAPIRLQCRSLSRGLQCENDCPICLRYIQVRTQIREEIESNLLRASLDAMHTEYDEDLSSAPKTCERCGAPRSTSWCFNALYLCYECEGNLEEAVAQDNTLTQCSQCGRKDMEVTCEHSFGPEVGAVCVACATALVDMLCFEKFPCAVPHDASCGNCLLCKASGVWIPDLKVYLCTECHPPFRVGI